MGQIKSVKSKSSLSEGQTGITIFLYALHKCDVWIDSRISAAFNWIEFNPAEIRPMNQA